MHIFEAVCMYTIHLHMYSTRTHVLYPGNVTGWATNVEMEKRMNTIFICSEAGAYHFSPRAS